MSGQNDENEDTGENASQVIKILYFWPICLKSYKKIILDRIRNRRRRKPELQQWQPGNN